MAGRVEARSDDIGDPDTHHESAAAACFSGPATWRTMTGFLGHWPLRGYGMWAWVTLDSGGFAGSIGIFQPLDWPETEIAYALDPPF
jgi:hypothetical protein